MSYQTAADSTPPITQNPYPGTTQVDAQAEAARLLQDALYQVKKVVVGQDRLVERVLVSLLANGHCLIEGYPGLAKTLTVSTLATVVGGQFSVLSTEVFFAIVGAQFDQGRAAALALVLTFFALAVFFIQQRVLGKTSYTTVSGKGDAGVARPLPDRVRFMIRAHCAAVDVVALFFGAGVGSAAFVPLDKGIAFSGSVIVETKVQPVQHRIGGKVGRVLVKEGQQVANRTVLVTMKA